MLLYYQLNEDELIQLLKSGDEKAFTELFDRFQPLLYVYACKITKDENIAADIVQDVFLNVWEKRATLQINSSLLSYLYQAVRFKFFDLLDKNKVKSNYLESLKNFAQEGTPITDNQIREKEMLDLLNKCIDLLPKSLKTIYILSQDPDKSNADIARELGISEKTVSNKISLAIAHIKLRMGILRVLVFISSYEAVMLLLRKF